MSDNNVSAISGVKKYAGFKPPVPARPKNLVVWNSKNLPKPPENVLTGNVTNFIKGLNLDSTDEIGPEKSEVNQNSDKNAVTPNSDEEDVDGYLEPVSLSFNNIFSSNDKYFNKIPGTQKRCLEENGRTKTVQKMPCSSNMVYKEKVVNNEKGGEKERKMCEDFCFYLKLARPISASLGRRFSNEMADYSVKFKRRVFKRVRKLFDESVDYLESIPEKPDCDDTKQHLSHSQRPLPLPPVRKESEISTMPWYKNVDRKKGEELLKDGIDGHFLIRPSSKEDTFLTLTLWFHNRLYNIPIRKRKDGKFALGTPKTNEQCFESIEEMVKNYQSEKLLLYSNGAKAGRTLLTTYPP